MPRYKIKAPDGRTVTIEAADEQTAVRGAREWVEANPRSGLGQQVRGNVGGRVSAGNMIDQAWQHVREQRAANPPSSRPRPAPRRGQARAPMTEFSQGLQTFSAGIPLMDEAQAGLGALWYWGSGETPSLGDGWTMARDQQRAMMDDFATRRPLASTFTRSSGTAASSVVPASRLVGLPTQAVAQGTRVANMARGATVGATQGAIYGLTDEGTIEERLNAGREGAVFGGATGGILSGVMPAAKPKPKPRPAPRQSDARVLRDAGVQLTPGQALGQPMKLIEDVGARTPILGGAIREARSRAGESFNRAVANRALAPLNETVPPTVRTGPEAFRYVENRLGRAFEDAYAMAPRVVEDDPFRAALAQAQGNARMLTPENRVALQGILDSRLERLRAGPLTGSEAGRVRSELAQTATSYIKKGGNEGEVGRIVRNVGNAMDDLIARSDPTGRAGPALERAREGWGSFAVMRRAQSNAGTGTFSPGQLSSATRAEAPTRSAVARGEARLQDLAMAAQRRMPDSFGNPGTSDVGAWVGLGGLTVANPAAGLSVAGGLGVAATPYMLMARNIAAQVPRNATRSQLQAVLSQLDELARLAPEEAQAIGALRDQLARQSGAATSTSRRPGPPR